MRKTQRLAVINVPHLLGTKDLRASWHGRSAVVLSHSGTVFRFVGEKSPTYHMLDAQYVLIQPLIEDLLGGMVYLAAPYSDPDKAVINARMKEFCEVDAKLIGWGVHTCSPLSKHFILDYQNLPGDWAYWGTYSEKMLKRCEAMLIVTIAGWDTSTGVSGEIAIARKNGIPVYLIDQDGTGFREFA